MTSLFSPTRPQLDSRPGLLPPWRSIVPILHLDPEPEGLICLTVLAPGSRGFHWHQLRLPQTELCPMLDAWREDPERVLRESFGWQEEKEPPAGPSLEDLGL